MLLNMSCLSEGRVRMQFLWPKCVLCSGAISRGGKNQVIPGVLAAKVAHSARAAQVLPLRHVYCVRWSVPHEGEGTITLVMFLPAAQGLSCTARLLCKAEENSGVSCLVFRCWICRLRKIFTTLEAGVVCRLFCLTLRVYPCPCSCLSALCICVLNNNTRPPPAVSIATTAQYPPCPCTRHADGNFAAF